MPAAFGPSLPSSGYRVWAVQGRPSDGCSPIDPAPRETDDLPRSFVVLLKRGNCTFESKIRNAQQSGYHAVIVYNNNGDELQQMSANNPEDIGIPSVFVGELTGKIINQNYQFIDDCYIIMNGELPFNINTHLILPFSIVVGLCFIIMIGFMIVKCVREQRRLRRHRLPASVLKTIPVVKFVKSLPYDMCAICLEDYTEGEKLRVLPCGHGKSTAFRFPSKNFTLWYI